MALTRRPRAGDVLDIGLRGGPWTVGFATDDGVARDEQGRAVIIWGFRDGTFNTWATLLSEGPDVPDPRSSLNLLHNGTPYHTKKEE